MMNLGHTLLIANPAAQNGKGAKLALAAERRLKDIGCCCSYDLLFTERPCHATDAVMRMNENYRSVIVLGGDGLVHEVVNGLMCRAAQARPLLGVVPLGSGNDYANALGFTLKPEVAVGELANGEVKRVDVGLCNGEFFAETLSFGLDAAIALETMELRKQTGESGTKLYFHAGIDQLLHHLDAYAYTIDYVDERGEGCEARGQSIVHAVQIGPTYGGGFKICPDARLDDGLFDFCIAHPPVSVARAVYVFTRAKNGGHTHMKPIEFLRASKAHIEFEAEPPCQIDGEPHLARTFDLDCVSRALEVVVAC